MSWSVSRVLYVKNVAIIHLGHTLLHASSNLPENSVGHTSRFPIWSCSKWGLPCHLCLQSRGALLPHHFTLTKPKFGGIFSAALAVGSRLPDVIRHPALWSPDFPRLLPTAIARPTQRLLWCFLNKKQSLSVIMLKFKHKKRHPKVPFDWLISLYYLPIFFFKNFNMALYKSSLCGIFWNPCPSFLYMVLYLMPFSFNFFSKK